jgi:hypothetical protein
MMIGRTRVVVVAVGVGLANEHSVSLLQVLISHRNRKVACSIQTQRLL